MGFRTSLSHCFLQVKLQLPEVPYLPLHHEVPTLSPEAVIQLKFLSLSSNKSSTELVSQSVRCLKNLYSGYPTTLDFYFKLNFLFSKSTILIPYYLTIIYVPSLCTVTAAGSIFFPPSLTLMDTFHFYPDMQQPCQDVPGLPPV